MAGPDAASGVDRRDVRVVVDGHVVPSDPKNHERREVPVPRFLIDELAAQVAGKASDALVFGGEKAGTPMRSRTFQRAVFDEAAAAVGLDGLTPHALRHTAASLAIAAGAAAEAGTGRRRDTAAVVPLRR
jgi:integrase